MHRITPRNASAVLQLFLLTSLCLITTGCPSHQGPEDLPLLGRHLSSRLDLIPNVGETVLITGTARYLKIAGPSVAADDFEVRIYPTNVWGPEMDGKRVQVSGRLETSTHISPPDPSITPGEYWLADAKWKLPPAEAKK
jgi:hypothetical protein